MDQENIIIRCGSCGTKNRIPEEKLKQGPVCGKCRVPLPVSGHQSPVDVTDQSFNSEVLSFSGPVLLDCWAPWCGPCRMVAPLLDQLASEYAGRVKIAKLNVDENPVIASQYGVQSIPTMILFNRGKQIEKIVGALPKHDIERHLSAVL